ncbi:selenite/tellurite reduction operon protein ExtJ [Citrifermentans bremense]|uniref:selenite/tellurite reduction operon protein ExtJ n=1 Tax=Citrifermentans bremense TaxID=60035 RepID=UPI0003F7C3DE|nr:selenite/tellurite reduction operon protein ExtJ [Citrifermentans bremense]
MKKIIALLAAAIITATLAVSAFAAGPVSGKVTKVDGEKVTVTVEGAVPAWAKKGANVTAAGGSPKVVSVQGNEVTLKFSKSKAAKIAVDSKMTLTECEGDEMQGC